MKESERIPYVSKMPAVYSTTLVESVKVSVNAFQTDTHDRTQNSHLEQHFVSCLK